MTVKRRRVVIKTLPGKPLNLDSRTLLLPPGFRLDLEGSTVTGLEPHCADRPVADPIAPNSPMEPSAPIGWYPASLHGQDQPPGLHFLKHCFLKQASAVLYERALRPLLMDYL